MGKDLTKNIGLLANKYKNVLIGDKLRSYFDQKDLCLVMIFLRWDDKITSYFKKILSRTCKFEHLKTIFGNKSILCRRENRVCKIVYSKSCKRQFINILQYHVLYNFNMSYKIIKINQILISN